MNSANKKVSGLVSVILPAYNAKNFIGQAIESIQNQTYQNFELLIIEDCSTDNTAEIIRKYAKEDWRIKAIYKEQNLGVHGFISNLNKGIELSQGEYIARMDADDISLPDRFTQQVKYLNEHKDVILVGGGAIGINESGSEVGRVKPPSTVTAVSQVLPSKDVIMHPTVMIRNTFDERYRLVYCEDYDLWLQMLKNGKKLCNLPQPLIKYRILKDSLSNKIVIRTYGTSILAQRIYQDVIAFEDADPNTFYENLIAGKALRQDYLDVLLLGMRIPSLELIFQLHQVIPFGDLKIFSSMLLLTLKLRRFGGDLRRFILKR